MKRIFVFLLATVVSIVVIDVLFGAFMRKVETFSDDKNTFCSTDFDSDILILGSSISLHDISPDVLEKNLGMSCYCAGEGGHGSLVAWARYNMCIRRHKPKMVIYGISPEYDFQMQGGENYSHSLDVLQNYYGRDSLVTGMFHEFMSPTELIKLNSRCVRYNPSWIKTLVHIGSSSRQFNKGHYAFHGVFKPFDKTPDTEQGPFVVDSVKLKYLTRLFDDTRRKGIKLVCVVPPRYYNTYNPAKYRLIYNLCRQYGVQLINNAYLPGISGRPELYYDSAHLNEEGAVAYTSILCQEIDN